MAIANDYTHKNHPQLNPQGLRFFILSTMEVLRMFSYKKEEVWMALSSITMMAYMPKSTMLAYQATESWILPWFVRLGNKSEAARIF